jgi:Asp-tRNA(Asn)/Glu-tRNA(Gln) amidotransferase C subunit
MQKDHVDVEKLLSTPSWSVASLLPINASQQDTPKVTSNDLHHLLRLSALPPPKDQQEEDMMLSTLSSQLHFVKTIQQVDTSNVQALRSLRDETAEGEKEAELGLDALRGALEQEEIRGKHHKRIRRKPTVKGQDGNAAWDVLGNATKRTGRYFVVEGGKDR